MTKSEVKAILNIEREHHLRTDDFSRGIASGLRIVLRITDHLAMAPTEHERDADGTLLLKQEGTDG